MPISSVLLPCNVEHVNVFVSYVTIIVNSLLEMKVCALYVE